MNSPLSLLNDDLVRCKTGGLPAASREIIREVERISRAVSKRLGRSDLAEDVAQEFWLGFSVVAQRFDPGVAGASQYIYGWVRNIAYALSRRIPVAMELNDDLDSFVDTHDANLIIEESTDRKIAMEAIERKISARGESLPSPESVQEEDRARKAKKVRNKAFKGPKHRRLNEIRVALEMTQAEFAGRLGVVLSTFISYEQGQTQHIEDCLMERAEALLVEVDEVKRWKEDYDRFSMSEILDRWAGCYNLDKGDVVNIARQINVAPSTVTRWRSGECRPSLRDLVEYEKKIIASAKKGATQEVRINS